MNATTAGDESSALARLALEAPSDALEALIEALGEADEERAEIGAVGLVRWARHQGKEGLPRLFARATSVPPSRRRFVLSALLASGEAGIDALFDLAESDPTSQLAVEEMLSAAPVERVAFHLRDPRRRSIALGALARFDVLPESLVEPLASTFDGSTDPEMRALVAVALGHVPSSESHLRRALSDRDPIVAAFALGALAERSALVDADVPLVVEALDGGDANVGDAVARGLVRAERLPAALTKALLDSALACAPEKRPGFLRAIGASLAGPPSPREEAAFATLLDALEAPEFSIRAAASDGLGRAGARWAARAVGPLCKNAVTPQPERQFFISIPAIFATVRLVRAVPACIDIVAERLTSAPTTAERGAAATILGELGRDAARALPALHIAIRDPEDLVAIRAAAALVAVGDAELGLSTIARHLADARPESRSQAVFTLGRIPVLAERCIAWLIEATLDRSPLVRRHAVESLARWGRDAELARSAIVARLGDDEAIVRRQALRALADIEASRVRVVPVKKSLP